MRLAKLRQRRLSWQWNYRLLLWSLGVGIVGFAIATVSYWHHSRTAGSSFMALADKAAAEKDYTGQVKWLSRYSLLNPGDRSALATAAIAADEAADAADPSTRYVAVDNARRQLASSIARLGDDDESAETIADLRSRLIERLLQLGEQWLIEAERQTVAFNADPGDAKAARWLAMSILGQVNQSLYQKRNAGIVQQDADFWRWLSNQPPGVVLNLAMDRNPSDLDLVANFVNAVTNHQEVFKPPVDAPNQQTWEAELNERIDRTVKSLSANQDSRSKWLLYSYYVAAAQKRN
jgi:hypothetical protein